MKNIHMKGDTIWQIMEEIGADGIELILPDEDDNLDSKYFLHIDQYTKEELNKLKDYNYIGWTPWFWKKMNGKINYLFGISNEGYLKWTEERNPYHRMSKYQGIRWSDLSKLFR